MFFVYRCRKHTEYIHVATCTCATSHSLIEPIIDLLHALCCLSCNVDELVHLKPGLHDVQVAVQCGAITPLRHYSDLGQCCPAHEEENVGVASFSKRKFGNRNPT